MLKPNFTSVALEINLINFVLAVNITLGEGEMTVFLFLKRRLIGVSHSKCYLCVCLLVSKFQQNKIKFGLSWLNIGLCLQIECEQLKAIVILDFFVFSIKLSKCMN